MADQSKLGMYIQVHFWMIAKRKNPYQLLSGTLVKCPFLSPVSQLWLIGLSDNTRKVMSFRISPYKSCLWIFHKIFIFYIFYHISFFSYASSTLSLVHEKQIWISTSILHWTSTLTIETIPFNFFLPGIR